MDTIPQFYKTLYSFHGGLVQLRLYHAAVFPVVNLTINNGIGEVLDVGVSRDRSVDFLSVSEIGQFCFRVLPGDVLDSG